MAKSRAADDAGEYYEATFDALNRRQAYVEIDRTNAPNKLTAQYFYDSRSNLVIRINREGNPVRWAFVGLSRMVKRERALTLGATIEDFTTARVTEWGIDKNGRLISHKEDGPQRVHPGLRLRLGRRARRQEAAVVDDSGPVQAGVFGDRPRAAARTGNGARVARVAFCLSWVPAHIRSDDGPAFTARAVREWLKKLGARTLFIEPGAPWGNGYAESFNSTLQDEFVTRKVFRALKEAQVLMEWVPPAPQRSACAQRARLPAASAGSDVGASRLRSTGSSQNSMDGRPDLGIGTKDRERPRRMNGGNEEYGADAERPQRAWRTARDEAFDAVMARRRVPRRRAAVARLVCWGYTRKGIARAMGMSVSGVKKHLAGLFATFGVHDCEDVAKRIRTEMGDDPPPRASTVAPTRNGSNPGCAL